MLEERPKGKRSLSSISVLRSTHLLVEVDGTIYGEAVKVPQEGSRFFHKGSDNVSWLKACLHLMCKDTMDKKSLKLL